MYSMLTKFVTNIHYLNLFYREPCPLQGYLMFKERQVIRHMQLVHKANLERILFALFLNVKLIF